MSALGHKRTLERASGMSALPPIADMQRRARCTRKLRLRIRLDATAHGAPNLPLGERH